ncbi:MAG: dipeptide epimerase [Bacteroidetes bacterium]|nr:dipeptide epimerase [Bacteroidota bacterium]
MKIKSIQVFKKDLRLQKPYTIARETISGVENVFLKVVLENGITGIGAANPDPKVVGESPDQTFQNLQSAFVSSLVGKDIRYFLKHIDEARKNFNHLPGTQACIDIALHDAFAQYLGISVVDFYGRQHSKMLTSVTIGIKDVQETMEDASEYYSKGFRVLKVKTGLNPEQDAERVIKIHEKFGNHFTVRVDANTGYSLDDLVLFSQLTKKYPVELIEQPILPSGDEALLKYREKFNIKLAADESLKNPEAALLLSHQKLYDIFNIKLMKCGGLSAAFEIANIAKPAGIELFWGCNDESIVSITAALHAAFACAHTRYIDLDGSLDLAEDEVSGGFILKDGYMYLDDKSGFGFN